MLCLSVTIFCFLYLMLNVGSAVIQTVMGSVTGIIIDGETGEAIRDVSVTISTEASNSDSLNYSVSNGASDGSFTVSAVGNCTITLEKDGYQTVEVTVDVDRRNDVDLGEIIMYDYLHAAINELTEEYGIFDSEQSGILTSTGNEEWFDPTGILSATIMDLDEDGEDELLIFRNEEYEERYVGYLCEDMCYRTLAEVYEVKNGEVVLASSITLKAYNDTENQVVLFKEQNCTVNFVVNAVLMDDGYYFVCIYSSSATMADGGYGARWVIEYRDETLQYVCSWAPNGASSSGSDDYGYEFEDGVNTKITRYCFYKLAEDEDPNVEVVMYETGDMDKFFAKYGLVIEYEDDGYRILGTSSEQLETETVLDFTIDKLDQSYDETYTITVEFESTLLRGNDLLD